MVHYYPRAWERKIEWWEPMQGRILVAMLDGPEKVWVVGVGFSLHVARPLLDM